MYHCLRNELFSYVCCYLDEWQKENYLSESFYYKLREQFNSYANKDNSYRAALFIALNKLGFNGLYLVNKKREFNVPWGKCKEGTKIYEPEKLEAVHKRLQNISIYCGDYSKITYSSEDFVYLDPPYDIESNNFTGYNKSAFDKQEQARLAEFCQDLTLKNVRFCQSNADTPYIRELYQNFRIVEIEAPRRISCNGDRTKAKELLIMNY